MKELMNISKRIHLAVVLALCVPAFAIAAVPQSSLETVQLNVSFADLNLGNDKGIDQLYRRIRSAAAGACGPLTLHGSGSIAQLRDNQVCYRDLLDKAVQKVDNAALSKRHFG